MLERLWSGWRSVYVSSVGSEPGDANDARSVFTRILQSGLPDEETHIVHRGTEVLMLAARDQAAGHRGAPAEGDDREVLGHDQLEQLDDLLVRGRTDDRVGRVGEGGGQRGAHDE